MAVATLLSCRHHQSTTALLPFNPEPGSDTLFQQPQQCIKIDAQDDNSLPSLLKAPFVFLPFLFFLTIQLFSFELCFPWLSAIIPR